MESWLVHLDNRGDTIKSFKYLSQSPRTHSQPDERRHWQVIRGVDPW